MKNKRTPDIRFPGFPGDWEQRKLGEILKVNSGRDYKHLQQGNIPVYGTGGYMLSVDDKLSDEDAIGIGRKGTINNPQLLKAPFWTVDTLFYMTTKEKNDLLFCYSLAKKIHWKKYDESTGVPSLSKSSIDKISIGIPTPAEQSKIGNFFKQLDDTIALYQQELTTLKQTKKGFLQKMFPKEGESVPEIRFPGFPKEWEQCNILEVSKVFIGLVTTMTENYRESGTLLIRNSDIKENRFEFSNNPIHLDESFAEQNHTRRLIIGDVVTVHTGDVGTSAVITERENGSIGFATINSRPNPNLLDSNYLATFFNTERHKKYAIKMSTGDGRSNYNLKDFNKLTVPLPSIEEQKQIGLFFKYFNKTIALHQKELELLQETKKAFLQKVFV
ncbi:restriction endonuclease subunit S [Bacillus cereus]|uniref:Type I restriction endonuclease subunit S n=1 Tax=Bacillus cereus TaxID=1396 RepID=A0A2C1LNS7_BACCE|nr:restriction endonuclease subunit S [Bacillus cereus]PGU00128.1 type I restriction endonuclease subunit S [Bacillus cereus]